MTELRENKLQPDGDAFYARTVTLDLGSIQPHVSGPHDVKTMTPVTQMRERKLKIHKAYLVSCVNSRVDDLAQAAEIVRRRKVADDVEFYIAAASSEVQAESERRGDCRV